MIIMTREETLGFISYLKNKENVVLESHIMYFAGMFRMYERDTLPFAKRLLNTIKTAPSVMDAYRTIAHESGKMNSNWKYAREISYMFSEDFVEYVTKIDSISETDKEKIINRVNEGHPCKITLKKDAPDEIKKWMSSYVPMIKRSVFVDYFPTEYLNFRFEQFHENDEKYLVSVQTDGEYNINGRKAKILRELVDENNKNQSKTIIVGFNGDETQIPPEKSEKIGKFLCEQLGQNQVLIKDYANNGLIVIKNFKV